MNGTIMVQTSKLRASAPDLLLPGRSGQVATTGEQRTVSIYLALLACFRSLSARLRPFGVAANRPCVLIIIKVAESRDRFLACMENKIMVAGLFHKLREGGGQSSRRPKDAL